MIYCDECHTWHHYHCLINDDGVEEWELDVLSRGKSKFMCPKCEFEGLGLETYNSQDEDAQGSEDSDIICDKPKPKRKSKRKKGSKKSGKSSKGKRKQKR